nr:hypothetical protein [Mycolicibacter terrae]
MVRAWVAAAVPALWGVEVVGVAVLWGAVKVGSWVAVAAVPA